ncbi:putative inactive receptor kinase At1g48480 [Wolffia australiana]
MAAAAACVLFLAALWLAIPGNADLEAEKAVLLVLRDAVGRNAVSWNETVSPCDWVGVVCQSDRVVVLRLPGAGLIGEIPDGVFSNLTALRTLSLRYNALSGPLPSDLAGLVDLRNLYLHGNRFSGEIPPSISSLVNLVRLNLADNGFTGEIPAGLGELKRLRTLYLDRNRLSGQIPDLNLTLDQFNVSYNQINGSIPARLRSQPASSFLGLQVCGLPSSPCPGENVNGPPPSTSGNNKKKNKLSGGAIAGIVVGSVVGLLLVILLLCFVCRRKSKTRSAGVSAAKPAEARDKAISEEEEAGAAAAAAAAAAVATRSAAAAAAAPRAKPEAQSKKLVFCGNGNRVFDLEDLLRASAEVLGKGTFGTAYKAVLEMGTVVAVKRLRDVNLTEDEFREKIEAVGSMSHPNLVPLLAYYFSKDEKLIVYDYMPMGSLSSLLHGSRGAGRSPLHWETRVSIALAAARGIEYIHSISPSSSHGNIKSSNVLMDKPAGAKVSDHGLAQLGGGAAAAAPNRLAGYRAPEVTDPRRISQKADVYSFGVLLLELLTGKAPAQALLNDEGVDLPRWVQSVVREEWTAEVFDSELLRFQSAEEEMMQLLQLAVDCTAQYPDSRPAMAEIVAKIEEIQRSSGPAKDESSAEI